MLGQERCNVAKILHHDIERTTASQQSGKLDMHRYRPGTSNHTERTYSFLRRCTRIPTGDHF
jgi:hypothetical protein